MTRANDAVVGVGIEHGRRRGRVVEDDGETLSAALVVGPADALGELGLGVRKEELRDLG